MEEEKKNLELVLSDGKDIDLNDDVFLSINNDEDTLDLTEITNNVKKVEGEENE